jgi:hypothetical protein
VRKEVSQKNLSRVPKHISKKIRRRRIILQQTKTN